MTTSDIIKKLIIAFKNKNEDDFYKLTSEYIELEEKKNHRVLASEIKEIISKGNFNNNGKGTHYKSIIPIPRDSEKGFPLLEIKKYDNFWEQLIIKDDTLESLKNIENEFNQREILYTYNLKYKNKILFCGQPGTGKTFTAQILSTELHLPLIYVRFDSIVSSYLGETATNLRKVFDYISNDIFIVLFDEFDIIGKNRDDHYEHGEIKRVVNNFLQMIDNFSGESIIIASTNHQHILDPALWRRFDDVIYFDLPDKELRLKQIELFLKPIKKEKINFDFYVNKTEGLSPSDIKLMCIEAMKYSILNNSKELTNQDLKHSLKKIMNRKKIKLGNFKK
ncbi:MAG TPA: ATP-binding protein [Ignavibacteria bacterium]|nr:ATP-binding protein [Ignavibacteria bacterium]